MKSGPVLFLILFSFSVSHSQSRAGQSGASARGSLTVTATVESSVWLVTEPDGSREVVVANAPDPKESFTRTPAPKAEKPAPPLSAKSKPAADKKADKQSAPAVRMPTEQRVEPQPGKHNDAAVLFSFPTARKQFDVTQETRVMDVRDRTNSDQRPVEVTTIVLQ